MTITNRPFGNQLNISINDDIHEIAAERHYLYLRVGFYSPCIMDESDCRFLAHPHDG